MENISQKPFEKKKKISLDINESFLKIVDELAQLTKNSRGSIIEALVGQGMSPFCNLLETTWKGYLKEGKWDEKEIKKLLQGLKRIRIN